ncbi:MAG: ATP-binding protein [Planktomarina sp.]
MQTNERFAVGYHLPKSDSVVGAMGVLVSDPVGIVHKLHQDCDFNGSAVEFFDYGVLRLRVTVQRTQLGAYLWQIEDAPENKMPIYGNIHSLSEKDNEDHRYALDDFPITLIKIDKDGTILALNKMAQTVFASLLPMEGKIWDYFQNHMGDWKDWIDGAKEGEVSAQAHIAKANMEDVEKVYRVRLVQNDPKHTDQIFCTFNDVSEIKTLEEQFTQSQKMQSIGQLAGGVAHDFNNLLTAISGHCDLLLLDMNTHSPGYSDLMQIHQNTNRAAALVAQLLSFSRKQSLDVQSLDLEDALTDLTHLLNRLVGEKVELVLDPIPKLKRVLGNKRQIEQVLMNLVVNARDAMPDGGRITILTHMAKVKSVLDAAGGQIVPGEYVVISVKDEGVGMDALQVDQIFEPFYTTKKQGEGTGLGLSTVFGIVKQCGGAIRVHSEVGVGTVFEVYLKTTKVVDEPLSKAPIEIIPVTSDKKEHVVLLVEDEAPVRAFASRALQMSGHKVVEADSAEAALTILEDKKLHVDVFVTDVIMPGMDGPTWVAEARQNRPDVKVVFVSGYAEDSFKGHEDEFEKAAFLPKPFSLAELTTTVQSLVT